MQINGVNSGHGQEAHQVTKCKFDHSASPRMGGAGAGAASPGALNEGQQITQETVRDGEFSLSAWMKDTLKSGRKLLGAIWGESAVTKTDAGETAGILDPAKEAMEQTVNAQVSSGQSGQREEQGEAVPMTHSAQVAAASAMVRQTEAVSNPYFAAAEDTGARERTLWEKVKVKFQAITGQLSRQFSGKNAFQAKQEEAGEDLRRHSRFRDEEREMECVLTDDSYLMDSYDKKGEYSQLTTKNR